MMCIPIRLLACSDENFVCSRSDVARSMVGTLPVRQQLLACIVRVKMKTLALKNVPYNEIRDHHNLMKDIWNNVPLSQTSSPLKERHLLRNQQMWKVFLGKAI